MAADLRVQGTPDVVALIWVGLGDGLLRRLPIFSYWWLELIEGIVEIENHPSFDFSSRFLDLLYAREISHPSLGCLGKQPPA